VKVVVRQATFEACSRVQSSAAAAPFGTGPTISRYGTMPGRLSWRTRGLRPSISGPKLAFTAAQRALRISMVRAPPISTASCPLRLASVAASDAVGANPATRAGGIGTACAGVSAGAALADAPGFAAGAASALASGLSALGAGAGSAFASGLTSALASGLVSGLASTLASTLASALGPADCVKAGVAVAGGDRAGAAARLSWIGLAVGAVAATSAMSRLIEPVMSVKFCSSEASR
jgi:hypothetical protein